MESHSLLYLIPHDIYLFNLFPFLDPIGKIFFKNAIFCRLLPPILGESDGRSLCSHGIDFFSYCSKKWPQLMGQDGLVLSAKGAHVDIFHWVATFGDHTSIELEVYLAAIEGRNVKIFEYLFGFCKVLMPPTPKILERVSREVAKAGLLNYFSCMLNNIDSIEVVIGSLEGDHPECLNYIGKKKWMSTIGDLAAEYGAIDCLR